MLQTCCATRCWAHNVIWNEICVAWLVWKLWVVAKEMRALAKRAKGDIAHQFSWCGGRLCLLSVATWYANASCRIWMILKPVLSCQQEIQEMFSTFGVMQLGQTYLHLSTYIWKDLNEQATILRGISWRMPARGSQSWRFRRQRSGQDATSLGSTVVGLGCYHMTCTRSFQNLWHTIAAIEGS